MSVNTESVSFQNESEEDQDLLEAALQAEAAFEKAKEDLCEEPVHDDDTNEILNDDDHDDVDVDDEVNEDGKDEDEQTLKENKVNKKRTNKKKASISSEIDEGDNEDEGTEETEETESTKSTKTAKSSKKQKKSASGSSGGPAAKKKKLSSEAGTDMVANYLKEQGRPFNSTKVFENLNKELPHSAVKTVLQALVQQGQVLEKTEGRAALYWSAAIEDDSISAEERKQLVQELHNTISCKADELAVLRGDLEGILKELSEIEAEPSNQALPARLEETRSALTQVEAALSSIGEDSKGALQVLEKYGTNNLDELQPELAFYKSFEKTTRNAVLSVVDKMAESLAKSRAEALEIIGIED